MKKTNGYMRGDLILHTWECALCHRTNFKKYEIEHREDCPFSVSFSFKNDRWWWTSLCGHKYHIEKLPATMQHPNGRYQMCDEVGNEIVTRRRLSGVRNWIFLNQGVLS